MRRYLLSAALIMASLGAVAQTQPNDPRQLTGRVGTTISLEKSTQGDLDDWSLERQSLELRYRTAQENIAYLGERASRRREQAAALDAKVNELNRRLVESQRLNDVIQDTLYVLLDRLSACISTDLPFLAEERAARMDKLKRVMASPDTESAEKLRFMLEALLIEAQYGETVEVQPATIEVDGRNISADILRLGRLTMYWRSPDGSRIGTWDPAGCRWVELPGKYNRIISRAIEMATRMRPTEIVSLPLGRITR